MNDIKINMLGTGSPRASLERSGPSQVLLIDETPILIDCGEGTVRQLMKAKIDLKKVEHLYFTHLHADHVYGYGQFLVAGWGSGRKKLTVVGPAGVKRFHNQMLELFKDDIAYRTSLGFPSNGILDVEVIEIEEDGEVPDDIPAKVKAARMVHNVPTFGYRFQVGEKAVVISGDTAPTQSLIELSEGANVLIHDCCLTTTSFYKDTTSPTMKKVWENLQKEHCTPKQAAETAQKAGVKQLVMTHFLPGIDKEEIYHEASQVFDGDIIVPDDLLTVSVSEKTEVLN